MILIIQFSSFKRKENDRHFRGNLSISKNEPETKEKLLDKKYSRRWEAENVEFVLELTEEVKGEDFRSTNVIAKLHG